MLLIDMDTPDLKAPEKFILVILSSYGNSLGSNIYPSIRTLSLKSCMSRSAVIDNLAKLEAKGYIGKRKGGVIDGQNVNNSYVINMEKLGFYYDKGKLVAHKPSLEHRRV